MPHPGSGFPIPPFEWPHVGRQWPPYNVESEQAIELAAWWPTLASRGATALRELVSGKDGIFPGGAANPSWVNLVEFGYSLHFDGGDYVDSGIAINTTENWSVAGWSIIADKTSDPAQALFGSHQANRFYVAFLANTGEHLIGYGDSWKGVTASAAVTNGVPFHWAFVGDEGTARLYIDAVQVDTFNYVGMGAQALSNLIGARRSSLLPYDPEFGIVGDMWDVRLYSRRLTDGDAWQLYDPATRWELHQLPARLWRLGVVAPPPPTIIPIAMHHYRSMRL